MKIVTYSWWTVEWYELVWETGFLKASRKWDYKSDGFFAKDWQHAQEIFNKKTGRMKDYFSGRIIQEKFTN